MAGVGTDVIAKGHHPIARNATAVVRPRHTGRHRSPRHRHNSLHMPPRTRRAGHPVRRDIRTGKDSDITTTKPADPAAPHQNPIPVAQGRLHAEPHNIHQHQISPHPHRPQPNQDEHKQSHKTPPHPLPHRPLGVKLILRTLEETPRRTPLRSPDHTPDRASLTSAGADDVVPAALPQLWRFH